jgi:hypothetical protein
MIGVGRTGGSGEMPPHVISPDDRIWRMNQRSGAFPGTNRVGRVPVRSAVPTASSCTDAARRRRMRLDAAFAATFFL